MEVIKKFPEDMEGRTAYKLMKSPEVKKMSEAEGSILEITSWIQYNSPDKETGEIKEVIAKAEPAAEVNEENAEQLAIEKAKDITLNACLRALDALN